MKKALSLLVIVFIIINSLSLTAFAVGDSVTSLNVNYNSGKLSYSGQVADGVYAVAILLYNSSEELLLMDTVGVDNKSFSGTSSIKLTVSGTYTVKASNYEGGSFKSESFEFIAPQTPPSAAEEEEEDLPEEEEVDLPDEEKDLDLPGEDKKPGDKDKVVDRTPERDPDDRGEGSPEDRDVIEGSDEGEEEDKEDKLEEEKAEEEKPVDKSQDDKLEEEKRKADRAKAIGRAVGAATGVTMAGGLAYWFLKIRKP